MSPALFLSGVGVMFGVLAPGVQVGNTHRWHNLWVRTTIKVGSGVPVRVGWGLRSGDLGQWEGRGGTWGRGK